MEYKPLSVIIVLCLLGASCCWGQEPQKAEQSMKCLGAKKAEQSLKGVEERGAQKAEQSRRALERQSSRGLGIQGSRASWEAARKSGGAVVCKQDGFELRKVSDSLYWLNDWQLPYPVYQFQTGDVDGDGRADAIVGVIKSTRFYPEKARRLFIFKQVLSSKNRQAAEKPAGQNSAERISQAAERISQAAEPASQSAKQISQAAEPISQSAEPISQAAERISQSAKPASQSAKQSSQEKQASTLQTEPASAQSPDEILARPLWMGSKLGGILEDFRFKDGGIRALESTTDSLYSVADYKWGGFGMRFEHFIIKGTDRQTAIKHLSDKPQ